MTSEGLRRNYRVSPGTDYASTLEQLQAARVELTCGIIRRFEAGSPESGAVKRAMLQQWRAKSAFWFEMGLAGHQ